MESLIKLRKKIDELDDEIMKLLEKRFEISKQVKVIKKINHIEVEDKHREKEIIEKTKLYTNHHAIKEVYKTIMDESKELQHD